MNKFMDFSLLWQNLVLEEEEADQRRGRMDSERPWQSYHIVFTNAKAGKTNNEKKSRTFLLKKNVNKIWRDQMGLFILVSLHAWIICCCVHHVWEIKLRNNLLVEEVRGSSFLFSGWIHGFYDSFSNFYDLQKHVKKFNRFIRLNRIVLILNTH